MAVLGDLGFGIYPRAPQNRTLSQKCIHPHRQPDESIFGQLQPQAIHHAVRMLNLRHWHSGSVRRPPLR